MVINAVFLDPQPSPLGGRVAGVGEGEDGREDLHLDAELDTSVTHPDPKAVPARPTVLLLMLFPQALATVAPFVRVIARRKHGVGGGFEDERVEVEVVNARGLSNRRG